MLCSKSSPEPEYLNRGTNEEISVEGYEPNKYKLGATIVLCVLTGGLLLLLLTWRPSIRLWFTHSQCPLQEATKILCTDIYKQQWEEDVIDPITVKTNKRDSSISSTSMPNINPKYFMNKNIKYIMDEESNLYTRLRSRESTSRLQDVYAGRDGLTSSEAKHRQHLYGKNEIKIEVQSVLQLIWAQLRNPFYLFQLYTIVLWSLQTYYAFAVCIALLSILSIASSVYETKRQSNSLRQTMTSQSEMHVIRSNIKHIVSSVDVVPGDRVLIEAGAVVEADMMVVDGGVVVTEALLTGESIPTTKVGIAKSDSFNDVLNLAVHKRHILYSGSTVLQLRGASTVYGVVINTGFNTVRGELVRSILFPKPIAFHLLSDFLKMFFVFMIFGFVATGWSIYTWLHSEPPATPGEIIYNSLDIITFVVPPILPATMTAINVWSQRRLKRLNIFCLSSNYISLAGPVDMACFDKTGTLTQDVLELVGGIPNSPYSTFSAPVNHLYSLSNSMFTIALASCHTLTSRGAENKEFTTSLLGHPMDCSIFSSLQWELAELDGGCINPDYDLATPVLLRPCNVSNDMDIEVAQIKVFPFESNEQRMTVIAKVRGSKQFHVMIKGAPENIVERCKPYSVPRNFEEVLTWYTLQGLRVIALAGVTHNCEWHQLEDRTRDELETDAQFLGLILFHNPLKPGTSGALQLLQHALIQTVMITGDNMATAMSVARSCNLVQPDEQMLIVRAKVADRKLSDQAARHLKVSYHSTLISATNENSSLKDKEDANLVVDENFVFVMDGHTWQLIRQYDRKLLKKLAYKGRVFSRMKPHQKVEVIEELQELGYQVAMCGDGCNDCGALKAAHVGLSLSSAEASVAAPFTSTQDSIDCMEKLIREGRATLVSSYASFKYNISCSMASLILVMIHFSIQAEPSDLQYLIMDLVLMTIPSLVIGNTGASDMLVKQRPTRRILHPLHITSMISFLLIQALMFIACWEYVQTQNWFEPFEFVPGLQPSKPSYENTALVIFSYYSFIIGALIFSHSSPFRKRFYTNYILTGYIVGSSICVIVLNFYSGKGFNNAFNFKSFPHTSFRWVLFLSAIVNGLFCFLWERYFLYGIVAEKVLPALGSVLPFSRKPHELLAKDLENDKNWPPVIGNESARTSLDVDRTSVMMTNNKTNTDSDDSDKEASKHVFMMRKLSKRNRFNASVRRAELDNNAPTPEYKHLLKAEHAAMPVLDDTHEIPYEQDTTNTELSIGEVHSSFSPAHQTYDVPRRVLKTFAAPSTESNPIYDVVTEPENIYQSVDQSVPMQQHQTSVQRDAYYYSEGRTPLASSSPVDERRHQ